MRPPPQPTAGSSDTCLSSKLSRRLRSRGLHARLTTGKKSSLDPTSKEKVGCHPCYSRKHKEGGSQTKLAWAKSETLSQKQKQKTGKVWRCGLSYGALASQIQSSEFKL
jgi:hypothetical protein